MKRLVLVILMLSSCCGFPLMAQNRALIIGVGHYPENSGWHDLSSVNDVNLLDSVLAPTFSIVTLTDAEATKEGIRRAVEELISSAATGDTIMIHFSGHGQQMLVLDGDTIETDSLDEAIVPYDAKLRKTDTYNGENHIRDNELGDWVKRLAAKAGETGAVFVSLDACHSDDADRGGEDSITVYRGSSEIFGVEKGSSYKPPQDKGDSDAIPKAPGSAEVVFISACQTYQRNGEYHGYGSLSYALVNVLKHQPLELSPRFLDSVYSEFSKLKLLQTPGVRATFEYEVPTYTPTVPPAEVDDTTSRVWIWIVVGALLLIIIVIIWRKKNGQQSLRDGF